MRVFVYVDMHVRACVHASGFACIFTYLHCYVDQWLIDVLDGFLSRVCWATGYVQRRTEFSSFFLLQVRFHCTITALLFTATATAVAFAEGPRNAAQAAVP